ncbi:hypothetical protein E1301_Tti004095 [Triplophysa tibetana]|uniref:Protocadherin-9 n=1 Tax=Triplophysa tibetana TaxID=1572043 RepID=A0A5A9NIF2_9TELE|nr:hypothetical protein E1301_Tti004095 [Triplophysa tibetana]
MVILERRGRGHTLVKKSPRVEQSPDTFKFRSQFSVDLRPLPDVAMTGKCTHECTEYGHSDSCWMPRQPSPDRTKGSKSGPKLSTFVPYQEREGQERLMADSSSKPLGEERSGGGSNKVASIRFLPPYTSAYSTGGDGGKDCPLEEIPLSQTADYAPATTPSSQGSKREIYL